MSYFSLNFKHCFLQCCEHIRNSCFEIFARFVIWSPSGIVTTSSLPPLTPYLAHILLLSLLLLLFLQLKIENFRVCIVATLDSDPSPGGMGYGCVLFICLNDFPHRILWSPSFQCSASNVPAPVFTFHHVFIFKPG